MDARQIYLDHLEAIGRMAASVCRRHGVFAQDAEDFIADVHLKLVEDDHAVLRKFHGRSSVTTYIMVVIVNLFRDYRARRWGRWRPSARARRLGDVAVQLESLVQCQECSLEEAYGILENREDVDVSRRELVRIARQLRQQLRPRMTVAADQEKPPTDHGPVEALIEAEDAARLVRAERVLAGAIGALPAQDQVMLRMHYFEGLTVADIARALHVASKPLYERLERLRRELRRALEAEGLGADALEALD